MISPKSWTYFILLFTMAVVLCGCEVKEKKVKTKPAPKPVTEEVEGEIIADDESPQFKIVSGKWGSGRNIGCYGEINHWMARGKKLSEAKWTLKVPEGGEYEVFARWTQAPNRATNSPYKICYADGEKTVRVDQQENGEKWNSLGTYRFSEDKPAVIILSNEGADNFVIADAVKLVPR